MTGESLIGYGGQSPHHNRTNSAYFRPMVGGNFLCKGHGGHGHGHLPRPHLPFSGCAEEGRPVGLRDFSRGWCETRKVDLDNGSRKEVGLLVGVLEIGSPGESCSMGGGEFHVGSRESVLGRFVRKIREQHATCGRLKAHGTQGNPRSPRNNE